MMLQYLEYDSQVRLCDEAFQIRFKFYLNDFIQNELHSSLEFGASNDGYNFFVAFSFR